MARTKTTTSKKPKAKKAKAKRTRAKKSAPKKSAPKKTKAKKSEKAVRMTAARKIVRALRDHALSLPDSREEFPWDHSVAKVGKKVFVFLDRQDVVDKEVRFSVKLPTSADVVLGLPIATPTGYGLGRSGWVSISFVPRDAPPLPMMFEWIEESYRAIAPKRKVAELDAR